MLRRILAVMLLGVLPNSAFAQGSDLVDATRPQVILSMARGFGSADLSTDSDGDPLIRGRMAGESYFILFYGCTKGARCNQIEFRTVLDSPRRFDERKITQWHRKYRYGKVYIDNSNDVILNYLVNLRGDGVSRANLEGSFEWFKQMMTQFYSTMTDTDASDRDDDRRRDDTRRRDRDDEDRPRPTRRETSSERERAPPRLPQGVGQN